MILFVIIILCYYSVPDYDASSMTSSEDMDDDGDYMGYSDYSDYHGYDDDDDYGFGFPFGY